MAAPITLLLTGVVDSLETELDPYFAVGDLISYRFTFESTTPAGGGSDVNNAFYPAMIEQYFTLGAYSGSSFGPDFISVSNDIPIVGLYDFFLAGSGAVPLTGPPISGLHSTGMKIEFRDVSGAVYDDARVLPTSLSLSDFSSARFRMQFVNDDFTSAPILEGIVTEIVPEPSSLLLAALGLIGFAAWGWRRTR